MKKIYSTVSRTNGLMALLFLMCLFVIQTYAQPPSMKTGYEGLFPVDNSVNSMYPFEQSAVNTIPGKSGGTGTESDPYIVATVTDLVEIADRINTGTESSSTVFPNGNVGNQYFLMANDLDISSYTPWNCIGIPGERIFYGNFDGGGHTITGLVLSASVGTNQGLFSVIGNNAIVHGITIKDSQLNGTYYTGAIAGAAGEFTTIYDCHNYSDMICSGYYTGGIAGASWGTIYNCTNSGNNSGADFCGGIVGDFYGTLYNCVNIGNILGGSSIGGIVGYADGGSIKNSVNAGNITATGGYNGGIVGFYASNFTEKIVSNCINFAEVNCTNSSSGAVIGRRWIAEGQPSIVANCFYDKQMTIKSGSNEGDASGVIEGKFTNEIIGNSLQTILTNNYIYAEGLYPCPANIETEEIAHVAIATAFFNFIDAGNFDRHNNVNNHFTVALDNDVEWSSSNEAIVNVSNNNVLLLEKGTVTISCEKGATKKSIDLIINNVPAMDCEIPVLETVTQEICSEDIPCLQIKFTQTNFATDGYNIYADGELLMNVPEWQIVSLTKDEITPNVIHCFTVTAVCTNGESDPSNEICETLATVGVENNDHNIRIYPNPVTSHVFVDAKGNNILTISIIDNLGRIVQEYHSKENTINVINIENLTPNLYFIKIEMQDGKTIVKKMIK